MKNDIHTYPCQLIIQRMDKIVRLPKWLVNHPTLVVKVGDIVARVEDDLVEHNNSRIHLGLSYTKFDHYTNPSIPK